jgi:hypothetical protein
VSEPFPSAAPEMPVSNVARAAVHEAWSKGGARIVAAPESKPWNLHEFTAADLDHNQSRVFYDFALELPDRGGRGDDTAEREAARARNA